MIYVKLILILDHIDNIIPNPTLSKRNSVDAHGLMGYKAMTFNTEETVSLV